MSVARDIDFVASCAAGVVVTDVIGCRSLDIIDVEHLGNDVRNYIAKRLRDELNMTVSAWQDSKTDEAIEARWGA